MSLGKKSAAAILLLGCVGCAHTPDVTMQYYLSAAKVTFKVTRTIACDAANNKVISTGDATPTVQHYADRDAEVQTVAIAPLKSLFANTDVKFEFYEDGRLKGINESTTGQGENILKTALSIASALRTRSAGLETKDAAADCAAILKVGKQSPISLVYQGEVKVEKTGKQKLEGDSMTKGYLALLPKGAVDDVCAVVDQKKVEHATAPVKYAKQDGDVLVPMRQPAYVGIRIAASSNPDCSEGDTIWEGRVLAGQKGEPYFLPIPKAVMFGKQTFNLAVGESGAVTLIQYATEVGTGQVLNVISSGLDMLQNEDTKRANAARAEADLIAAQQRLVKCRADPKNCS